MKQVPRPPAWLLDAALALGFGVLEQVELHTSTDDGYRAGPMSLNVVLQLLFAPILLLRSRRPRLALALMCVWLVVPTLVTGRTLLFWGNFLPLMLVNYTVARTDRGWLGRWSWLVCVACVMTLALRVPDLRSLNQVAFPVVMLGVPSALGVLVRRLATQRSELAAALAELTDQQRLREQSAVAGERRRIAAEMHDVVAHAVSLMAVQVGAARLQLEAARVAVPPQLRAAEETGRSAVADLRRSLGVLKEDGTAAELEPVPDLEGIAPLVARFEDAGLQVEVDTRLSSVLPPSLQLSAYRIVQESLTNVLKHAGAARVTVEVTEGERVLTVRVANGPGAQTTGPAPSRRPAGHGLAAMRERVAMYDGTLRSARTGNGGFEVVATLPVPAAADQGMVRS